MIRQTLTVLAASLAVAGVTAAHAQDKTRAEVKAETRAAGVHGNAPADKASAVPKVKSDVTRAQVKAETRAAGVRGDAPADAASAVSKEKSGVARADVKAATRAAGIRGHEPVDGPKK